MKLFNQILGFKSGVLLFATVLIFSSCASDNNDVNPITNIQKLKGKWRVNSAEEFEEWFPSDGFPFNGVVYSSDENKKEKIVIEKIANDIVYKAKVFDEKGPKIIGFKMIDSNNEGITFKNEGHDFPNKIAYRFKSPNNMEAVVSGERDQQPIEMTLKFERVQ